MKKKFGWHFEKENADSLMLNNWNNIDIQDYTRFYILYNRQYVPPPLTWSLQKRCPFLDRCYLYMIRRETPFSTRCPV